MSRARSETGNTRLPRSVFYFTPKFSKKSIVSAEEKELKHIYEKSFKGKMPNEKNLYSENEPLAGTANRIINAKAGLRWATGSHSAGLVPVYAIGVGAEHFSTCNDNASIPLQIAKIAGYPMP